MFDPWYVFLSKTAQPHDVPFTGPIHASGWADDGAIILSDPRFEVMPHLFDEILVLREDLEPLPALQAYALVRR